MTQKEQTFAIMRCNKYKQPDSVPSDHLIQKSENPKSFFFKSEHPFDQRRERIGSFNRDINSIRTQSTRNRKSPPFQSHRIATSPPRHQIKHALGFKMSTIMPVFGVHLHDRQTPHIVTHDAMRFIAG